VTSAFERSGETTRHSCRNPDFQKGERRSLTTRIHGVTDARGLPITLELAAGQAHDRRSADDIPGTVGPDQTLLPDTAYDSDRLRDRLSRIGAKPVIRPIPRRTNPLPPDRDAYRRRSRGKRFFSKLTHYRTIATRHEKHDTNVLALVRLAATRIRLRVYEFGVPASGHAISEMLAIRWKVSFSFMRVSQGPSPTSRP